MGIFITDNLTGPTNIWFDADGDLFALDYNGAVVRQFDAEGKFIKNLITGVSQCEGVAFLPNGDILLGAGAAKAIRQYTSEGLLVSTVVPSGTLGLKQPNAVVLHEELSTGVQTNPRNIEEKNIVMPSIGLNFRIAEDLKRTPDSKLEMISISGDTMLSVFLNSTTLIDASDLPDGIYVITLLENEVIQARQRVVVRH